MAEQAIEFDQVELGDEAPAIEHELTRTDLVEYAGASGDFNPMHHDDEQARAVGLPSVFGHGMLTMGLLSTAITDHVGVGNLRSLSVRFTKQTWPGEELTTRVVVRAKREEGGEKLVDFDCEVTNSEGQVKVAGTATAVAA